MSGTLILRELERCETPGIVEDPTQRGARDTAISVKTSWCGEEPVWGRGDCVGTDVFVSLP